MRRFGLTGLLILGALCGCKAPPAAAPAVAVAGAETPRDERLAPSVFGTDDMLPHAPSASAAKPAAAKPAPVSGVDEKARMVRIPARFTRATGVVEWLLSAGAAHPATSVLVTDCPVRDVAGALAKIGLVSGARPQPVGDDRARPPSGSAVAIDVVVRDGAGKESRIPASRFLSARSDGPPLGEGAWIYVGPQAAGEGDSQIVVTDLSGSLVTTNLRDSSGMIYWTPKTSGGSEPYVSACYASSTALPGGGGACEIEIRPVSVESRP
ncbi:MAG: YdjY domain-containing protein [Planctomycetota bacterium]|nr:YdjY domain-containing protein [Planctomycetota bacterium]